MTEILKQPIRKKEYSTNEVKKIFLFLYKMSNLMDLDLYAKCGDEYQFKIVDEAQLAFENIEHMFNIPKKLYFLKYNNKEWEHLIKNIELSTDNSSELGKSLNKISLLLEREWEASLPDESVCLAQNARNGFEELNEILRK